MGRHRSDGEWANGLQDGAGVMTFQSGDVYRGEFQENLPHGKGAFDYVNGDHEDALWDKGQRHGLSR